LERKARIVLIIVAACIVTAGTAFGVVVAATWGQFEYSDSYYYKPGAPSPIEVLNFNSDIGQINIKYNTTPTEYYAQVELDIKIVGGFVAGKIYSDFFYPVEWDNISSIISFDLDAKSNPAFIFGLSHGITIDVTLRTDVVYDIDAYSTTGAIDMDVPDNVVVDDTSIGTTTGSVVLNSAKNTTFQGVLGMSTITGSVSLFAKDTNFTHGLTSSTITGSTILNFTRCIVSDNLIGTITTGSLTVNSYNMIYMKDCTWNLQTVTGSVDIQVFQYIEMNASITGTIGATTGSVDILYDDSLSSVGAQFTCSVSGFGSISYTPLGSGGMGDVSGVISSSDYGGAINKYTFGVSTTTGSIEVLGRSL
jgi:hypothetical protein